MPYFVFHVAGDNPATRQLDLLDSFENYRDARTRARKERRDRPEEDTKSVRVIFAESQDMAEGLLRQPREAPILQEWEK